MMFFKTNKQMQLILILILIVSLTIVSIKANPHHSDSEDNHDPDHGKHPEGKGAHHENHQKG